MRRKDSQRTIFRAFDPAAHRLKDCRILQESGLVAAAPDRALKAEAELAVDGQGELVACAMSDSTEPPAPAETVPKISRSAARPASILLRVAVMSLVSPACGRSSTWISPPLRVSRTRVTRPRPRAAQTIAWPHSWTAMRWSSSALSWPPKHARRYMRPANYLYTYFSPANRESRRVRAFVDCIRALGSEPSRGAPS
ncbi:hypothetical protein [Frigidibacter mobilis]|uniref:Uncharacterized protein n=1 Tax=Frigidibacter mobilis TaxID=1335048 RepID=A0A159Z5T4_9RHOB|nr:hypothetical protein [Frigidibacter mobilis]AMY70635.1 hypothetical protein AKL17_3403 [Frigidibacter mobilis]